MTSMAGTEGMSATARPNNYVGTEIRKSPGSGLSFHLHQARDFHGGALRCLRMEEAHGANMAFVNAGAANLAFAVELYLKALPTLDGQTSKGHALAELFDRLSDVAKSELVAAYHAQTSRGPRLATDIAAVSSAFIQWRYVYERDSATLDLGVLLALAVSLYDVTLRLFPQERPEDHLDAELRSEPLERWVELINASGG